MKQFAIVFILSFLLLSCGLLLDEPPGSLIRISEIVAVPGTVTAAIAWTTDIPSVNEVLYGTTPGTYTLSTPVTTTPGFLHTVSISGLSTGTTYYFVVQNSAYGAATSVSGESDFTTATAGNISNLRAENITYTSADIRWDTTDPTTNLVEYRTAPGPYIYSTIETTSAFISHTVSLTGLTSGTTYYYRVKTYLSGDLYATSTEQSFATATETPPTLAQKLRGIWIIGGLSTSSVTSVVAQVDLFDPDTGPSGTWYENVTSLPTPVSFAAAASWGGKIYVMGGFDGFGNVVSLNQEYTISTNSWTNRSPIGGGTPAPRANIHAVMTNNKIYILGGTTGNAALPWAGSNISYEYNPATDAWSTKTAITVLARSEILTLAFNDVVYHLGGRSAALTVQTTHDGLAVTTNGLTAAVEVVLLTTARTGHSGVLYAPGSNPALMAVVGGFSVLTGTTGNYPFQGTTASTPLNTFQFLYYPFSGPAVWQNATVYPSLCGFSAAALYGSILYVFGGATSYNSGPINSVYSFDVSTLYTVPGTWTARPIMQVGRFGHRAVTINQ